MAKVILRLHVGVSKFQAVRNRVRPCGRTSTQLGSANSSPRTWDWIPAVVFACECCGFGQVTWFL